MILSKKVRLYPTEIQEQKLWQSVGTTRFIYNWTLNKQQENYKNGGKFIKDSDLRKEITLMKKTDEYKWLSEVSNNVAKQAVKDCCNAYKRFFKGLADKPRFKSRKKSKLSFYNDNVKLKVKTKLVNIEKVGWIKTKEQIPINVKYTNPRISFDGKYWYLSVGIEKENPTIGLTDESIGIDMGIKDLAICSNGMTFKNINKSKEIKRLKKVLKRKQRKVSRKYDMNKIIRGGENRCQFKKTNNIIKLEKEIRLLHRRLRNIRSNHIHQATNKIVKTKPSRVVMETLNIKGMLKNKHLSKAISEQCLYDFKVKMEYKCKLYGIEFIEADKWYPSSKTCSCCGAIKKDLKLSDRVYKCNCGLVIDRDLNASINLSRYKLA
ncbi:IS200/IS605 family element transposase accessory protein TnpB [Clostridium botulinum C]|uniref:RNA-guided endonuclease InsQ/TnpB family protein n=2 Tax=Clostridium TaxID=1485 RepID=UPI001E4F0B70|nr:transposase [Clostridium botulinum]MCD3246234.1 IS200/IS605 family element transposase accessory protein TnpB [Clostridium botulinum C]MCD3260670.1 IS200/IS605 family element transposase accessory protein TnpB [Clostridium botulinum C]